MGNVLASLESLTPYWTSYESIKPVSGAVHENDIAEPLTDVVGLVGAGGARVRVAVTMSDQALWPAALWACTR